MPGSSETRSETNERPPAEGHFAESATKLFKNPALADTADDIVPIMSTLVDAADQYLRPEHYRSDPDRYARNLVYDDKKTGMSHYRLVWEPGQWIPVHDQGTWGGVGIIEDQLEEQSYMRLGPDQSADRHDGIKL